MPTLTTHELFERIKSAREARGMSQAELARRSGVPQPTINMLESGKRTSATPETIAAIAKVLGLKVAKLPERWSVSKC